MTTDCRSPVSPRCLASLVLAFSLSNSAGAAERTIVAAARTGDAADVAELITAGADVNLTAGDGSTPLLWATWHSDTDMIAMLLAAGADPNAANHFGVAPLLQASRTGDVAVMRLLLDAGASIDVAENSFEPLLHAAARTGRLEAVDLLLARGSDPNAIESEHDQTALMWAASEGHVQIVSALLEAGADPNLRARMNLLTERTNADFPSGGFTALMWAARNGYEDVVRTLVAGGADIDMRNADLASAMMISIVNDRFDMAELLLELGADANDSSLYEAVVMRDATTDWYARDGSRLRPDHDNENTALDLIAMLLEHGADPNLRSGRQMHSATMCCDTRANASAFYRAAVAADVAALELLIEYGADVSWTPPTVDGGGLATNANAGKPALIAAMTGGQGVPLSAGPGYARQGPPPFREEANRSPVDAVALLLDAGADANAALPDGSPALHEAVKTRYLEMVEKLVAAGARLDAKDKDGLTALHIAEQLPTEDPDNPFGRATLQKGSAEPAQLAAYLRQAMTNAGIPIEPAPPIESEDASGS